MAAKEKPQNSSRRKILIYILIGIIVILIAGLVIIDQYYANKINKDYNKKPDKEWLVNNCKCLEYNGTLSCPENFELMNNSCRNSTAKTFTSILVSCSKYKCPEYEVEVGK